MSSATSYFENGSDPIAIAETLAMDQGWDFDLIDENQLAIVIEGPWGDTSVTLSWSAQEQLLRLVCGIPLTVPEDRLDEFRKLLDIIHNRCWMGTFVLWPQHELIVFRYQLLTDEETVVSEKLIARIIDEATNHMECFFPALKSVAQTGDKAEQAIQMAITKAYGRA